MARQRRPLRPRQPCNPSSLSAKDAAARHQPRVLERCPARTFADVRPGRGAQYTLWFSRAARKVGATGVPVATITKD